jgi:hypothetical protein
MKTAGLLFFVTAMLILDARNQGNPLPFLVSVTAKRKFKSSRQEKTVGKWPFYGHFRDQKNFARSFGIVVALVEKHQEH